MMEQHCPVGYGTGTPDLDRTKQGFQGGLISTVIFFNRLPGAQEAYSLGA